MHIFTAGENKYTFVSIGFVNLNINKNHMFHNVKLNWTEYYVR